MGEWVNGLKNRINRHEEIKNRVEFKRPLKVVVDAGNATAGKLVPDFIKSLGFDVVPLQSEAVINISLCRSIRGLGLSPFVINRSIEELLKVRRDVRLIKAYVKDGNIASIKAFERAGFRFLEDTMFNECKTRVYERSLVNG